ncbi:MAG: serine hydrolase [Pseudomonadota bacterium]
MERSTKVCLWLIAVAMTSTPASARDADTVERWVEDNVPEMMREAQLPGFSIAVVKDGETIYADAFGARDPQRNLPATTDTLFGIGSITKSFVAVSILQLAEQGKLSLDDPVSEHLPLELGDPDEPIRIRHLLTHSPGFPNLATSTVLISRGLGEDTGIPMASAEDFFRFVNGAKGEEDFPPGERFFYNNAAWRMLGAIIQEKSGVPFHQYVTDNVIRKLGMERSTFNVVDLFADPDHLTPHRKEDGRAVPANFPYPNPADNTEFSFLSAAGGISSSVIEMTRYMNMLIETGRHGDDQLISRRSMREMQTLHIAEPDSYYGTTGYGFGLGITPDFLGEKLVDHGGSISVSTAHMALIPEEKLGVVMMGNGGGMSYAPIAESIFAILLGETPENVIPALYIPRRMERLTGSYSTYRDVQRVDVVKDGGTLWLRYDDSDIGTPLIPDDPSLESTRFHTLSNGRRTPIEFIEDDEGQLTVIIGRYIYRKAG